MKYRISTIGKIKSNDEDLITRKYLKRIKNIELKQYEVKTKNKDKKLNEEADKLINSTPKNGKLKVATVSDEVFSRFFGRFFGICSWFIPCTSSFGSFSVEELPP